MGGQQSTTAMTGGSRQGLTRKDVETLVVENAKRLQLLLASDKRKSGLPGSLRADTTRIINEVFSRQMEFSKGNLHYVESIRKRLDEAYQSAFHPTTPEAKILVRNHVDELVSKLQEKIEVALAYEQPQRHVNAVQQEQVESKERAGQRNARARAGATRRASRMRASVQRMKGGFLSWFSQRSTAPSTVPFRNYTRSLRAAKRENARQSVKSLK